MHVKTYALGIVAALGTTMVCFAGCGTTVSQAMSGSGAGGSPTMTASASSASSSNVATTSTGTSASSSSSSSGTGGANPCEQGCAHAAMCGLDVCGMAGINCATAGTQYDCLANCIDALPCAQLNAQSALACYQSCQGAADGGAVDGGSVVACSTCALQSCQQSAVACVMDTQCQAWLTCVDACTGSDPTCVPACNTMYASSAPLYDPLFACTCTSCSSQCSLEDPCAYASALDGG